MDPKLIEYKEGSRTSKDFQMFLGAIDGSNIPIKPSNQDRDSYINRKKFRLSYCKLFCDHNMFFLDCYCGWLRSVHDARVLRNSDLFDRIQSNPGNMFPCKEPTY